MLLSRERVGRIVGGFSTWCSSGSVLARFAGGASTAASSTLTGEFQ